MPSRADDLLGRRWALGVLWVAAVAVVAALLAAIFTVPKCVLLLRKIPAMA